MTCLRCQKAMVKGFYCTNCGYVPEKGVNMETYSIYRYFEHSEKKLIAEGLTLDAVKEHCSSPDTYGITDTGKRWFDGFVKE